MLFPTHPTPASRIAALERMGAAEPLTIEESADPEIRQATQRIISEARHLSAAPQSIAGAIAWGLLIGVAVQTWLIGLLLHQYGAEASFWKDVRLLPVATPFGFAGTAAAFVAMRISGRFYWWPLVLIFVFGTYIPFAIAFTLLPDNAPSSAGSGLLMCLIAVTEPLAGAVLGTFARQSLLEMLRDRLFAAGK